MAPGDLPPATGPVCMLVHWRYLAFSSRGESRSANTLALPREADRGGCKPRDDGRPSRAADAFAEADNLR